MAERIVQEESLTTVADAIRAKGGTTDPLSFPTGFADAIAAIQAGGGGGGSIEGLTVRSGSFTPSAAITTTYDIIVDPENPTGSNNRRYLFFLFRTPTESDTRGITTAGLIKLRANLYTSGKFGSYAGGTGANNTNLNYHSISSNDYICGNTVTITCSSTAPLSANKYIWIELSQE